MKQTVKVKVVVKNPNTDPQIICKPDPLNLKDVSDPVCIEFNVVTAGFKFPSVAEEGIKIIDNNNEQFSNLHLDSVTRISVTDANEDHWWYQYEVSVLRDDGLEVTTDPLILNK